MNFEQKLEFLEKELNSGKFEKNETARKRIYRMRWNKELMQRCKDLPEYFDDEINVKKGIFVILNEIDKSLIEITNEIIRK